MGNTWPAPRGARTEEVMIGGKMMRKIVEMYTLDVTLTLEVKSSHPEDRRKMTEPQIAIYLHRYCPHMVALTNTSEVVPRDYTKKKVTAVAKVRSASSGRAIDIVTNEIAKGNLDRHYKILRVNVRKR